MPAKIAETTVALQVELAVSRLDSLSTLPCVAFQLYSRLLKGRFSPASVADIVESDPALAVEVLRLIHKQGVDLASERFSLRHSLARLDADSVRDALLSVKVLHGQFTFDTAAAKGDVGLEKGLLLHSLAVACCAGKLAEAVGGDIEPQLAYCAGLLHDIGKFALEQAMPRSLARIFAEAESSGRCSCEVELEHLSTDHTLLGKHLAQRWHLPEPVMLAVWLHHSDAGKISEALTEARLAQIVRLADSIARQASIGRSGSYDSPGSVEDSAARLGISSAQLADVRRTLSAAVEQKSMVLRLDMPTTAAGYCNVLQTATAQLGRDNTQLLRENHRLQTVSARLNLVRDLLLGIDCCGRPIEIIADLAARWQKFYQTGRVCAYLAPDEAVQSLECVVVEGLGESEIVVLDAPTETPAIPEAVSRSFAVLDARDRVDWLFEQLDVDFDLNRTRLVPLISAGKAVGVLVFEFHYPADIELFEENFRVTALIAGVVLDMALQRRRQQHLAECFARLIGGSAPSPPSTDPDSLLDALAEMAAGAAHELNNPLSVISGRAQLLTETETNRDKKEILRQIEQKSCEASAIIEDLMSFAEPPQPRPALTDTGQIIDEAVQLTIQKTGIDDINIRVDIAGRAEGVFVDSAQVVSAIANVIANAVESYDRQVRPIQITAEKSGDMLTLQIEDHGCGMDPETLKKAIQPFFSYGDAGRRRGMGLAYAARFIRLNRGSLHIESEPGRGTTVTINLPTR